MGDQASPGFVSVLRALGSDRRSASLILTGDSARFARRPETQTPVVLPARGAGPPVKDGTTGVRWCLGPRSKGATQRCAGARVLLRGHHLTVHLGQIDHWITSFVSAGVDERSLSTATREETAGVSPRALATSRKPAMRPVSVTARLSGIGEQITLRPSACRVRRVRTCCIHG